MTDAVTVYIDGVAHGIVVDRLFPGDVRPLSPRAQIMLGDDWDVWAETHDEDVRVCELEGIAVRPGLRLYTTPRSITAGAAA